MRWSMLWIFQWAMIVGCLVSKCLSPSPYKIPLMDRTLHSLRFLHSRMMNFGDFQAIQNMEGVLHITHGYASLRMPSLSAYLALVPTYQPANQRSRYLPGSTTKRLRKKSTRRAASILQGCDGLLVLVGAGMGVDSGLSTFRAQEPHGMKQGPMVMPSDAMCRHLWSPNSFNSPEIPCLE